MQILISPHLLCGTGQACKGSFTIWQNGHSCPICKHTIATFEANAKRISEFPLAWRKIYANVLF